MRPLTIPTVALATSLLAAVPALAQQNADQSTSGTQQSEQANQPANGGEIRPLSTTCQDIIDTDVELVPQLVYWIDGYNIAYDAQTGEMDVDPVVTVAENEPRFRPLTSSRLVRQTRRCRLPTQSRRRSKKPKEPAATDQRDRPEVWRIDRRASVPAWP